MKNLLGAAIAAWMLCGTAVAVPQWNEGGPKIRGPKVYGATPGRTFLYSFPTTGSRDGLGFSVVRGALPPGVTLDKTTGVLSGRVAVAGDYAFTVKAANRLGSAEKDFTLKIGSGCLSLTPPLGWTSWNAYATQVDQELVAATAKALVDTGLAAYGYSFVNIDSCWQGARDKEGTLALQPNPKRFPDMKGLVDGIHALGLKAGIYSTPMVLAWGGSPSMMLPGGSYYPLDPKHFHKYFGGCGERGFEKEDAAQFAAWGFDWLKYDWPNTDPDHAAKMRAALDATGRDVVLQLCTECKPQFAADYAKSSSVARGSMDTHEKWEYMVDPRWNILRIPDQWLKFIRPGFWYDMDMLAVGPMCIDRKVKAPRPGEPMPAEMKNRFSSDEIELQFWWWAMLPSPIVLSCDLMHIDELTLSLATNDDLLAINQDYPATPVSYEKFENDTKRISTRRLSDGRLAIGFFNFVGDKPWSVTRNLGGLRAVRDARQQRDLGKLDKLEVTVPVHGCRVFLVDGE